MAFTEDFDEFLDTDDFAVSATYTRGIYATHPNATTSTIYGILANAYVETQQIQGSRPIFATKSSNVSNIANGDWLTVSGDVYKVRGYEPDGTGWIRLILEEQ